MNTQQKDRQSTPNSGNQQNDQNKQQKQAFKEGNMDNSENQPGNKPSGNDPEIETPVHNPEKTEKKIPDMKGDHK